MTVTYDAENKLVELIADCPKGATGVKAYKDGKYLGLGYIVGDKITKKFSNITKKESRTEHVYTFGLSALFGEIESEIATVEFVVPEVSVDPYVLGTSNITGTYKGDVKHAKVYYQNEGDPTVKLIRGTDFKDGTFRIYVGNVVKSETTIVRVQAFTGTGDTGMVYNELIDVLPAESVEVNVDNYTVGDGDITGTYTGDADKAKPYVNDAHADVYGGTFKDDEDTIDS